MAVAAETAAAARRAVARRGARAGPRAQPRRPAPQLHRRPRDAGERVPQAARARSAVPRLPARVRRAGPARRALQLHRRAPAQGRALVAGRRRRPLRAGRGRGRRLQPGAVPRRAALRGRRRRLLRLRPRAHRRAARRPQPGRRRAAGHGAHALRRARGLRPPQAHDHDPRQRLRRRRGRRRRLRRRPGHDREGAPPARRAGARRRADAVARPADLRVQHAARAVRGDGRAHRRVRARRRRLPGRPLPALERRARRRPVLDLSRPAGGQPEPVHVLPGLHGLPDRRARRPSRC